MGAGVVVWEGMKTACLDRRSTTTSIASKPSEGGKALMKSMEMELHGRSPIGSGFNKP
jgi:hypothetical protein